jgi:hypothetical protein
MARHRTNRTTADQVGRTAWLQQVVAPDPAHDEQETGRGQRLHHRVQDEPHLERALAVEHPGRERHDHDEQQPEQVPPQDRPDPGNITEQVMVAAPVTRDHDEADQERDILVQVRL